MKVYIIGSLRNPKIPEVANTLQSEGFDAFDSWFSCGPEADDKWREHEKFRGHTYAEALNGYAAGHIFQFDKSHLDTSDAAVLVMPAGKSAHLELGYMIGKGKPGFILFDGEPDRLDLMPPNLATDFFFSREELFVALKNLKDAVDSGLPF